MLPRNIRNSIKVTMNTTVTKSEEYRCRSIEIMAVSDEAWERQIKTVWHICEGLSIFGFCLLLLTAYLFPTWRRNAQSNAWMQLCFSYLLFTVVYVQRDFSTCMAPVEIFIVIYFGQVTFCWILSGAWIANKRLVLVFADSESYMWKVSVISWLAPLPCDFLRLALDLIEFPDILFNERRVGIKIGAFTTSFKSILGFIYFLKDIGMYFPVIVPVVGSVVAYAHVIRVLWKNRQVWGHRQDVYGTAGLSLLFLMLSGVHFVFVCMNRFYTFTKVDLYLACIITSKVFINTVLFLVAIKKTRQMWVGYIRAKFCGAPHGDRQDMDSSPVQTLDSRRTVKETGYPMISINTHL